ncbi:MAG: DUF3035 domain-containing protein [Pseudomonadota bacterium]
MDKFPAYHGVMRTVLAISATGLVIALSGCGDGIRKELGIVGEGPDEFRVVRRAPLERPTDLSALPAPQPGAVSRVEPQPLREAQEAVLGRASAPGDGVMSSSEQQLLQGAGASDADDRIRAQLAEDQEKSAPKLLLDRYFSDGEEQREALDAGAEVDRLVEKGTLRKPGDSVPTATE